MSSIEDPVMRKRGVSKVNNSDAEPSDVVMRKRNPDAKRGGTETSADSTASNDVTGENIDHDAVLSDLLSNPERLKDMLSNMNIDGDKVKNIMRDITSDPSVAKGARDMMGVNSDAELREKLRKAMTKDGKAPTLKQMRKRQREMKKMMNRVSNGSHGNDRDDSERSYIYIDASKKLKVVTSIPILMLNSSQINIGSLGVRYFPNSKVHNRVAKRILGGNYGNVVLIHHIGGDKLVPTEDYLKHLAQTPFILPPDDAIVQGSEESEVLDSLIQEFCMDTGCKCADTSDHVKIEEIVE